MTQAVKVAEIFAVAGEAFTKLSNLSMLLQASHERGSEGGKWTDEEVQLLKSAIQRFGDDIEKISQLIKTKSQNQIKNALKQKAIQNLTSISANATQHVSSLKSVGQTHLTVVQPSTPKLVASNTTPIIAGNVNTKSPIKINAIPTRIVGEKSKAPDNVVTISASNLFDLQQQQQQQPQKLQPIQIAPQLQPAAAKKICLEPANLSQIISASVSPSQIVQGVAASNGIPVVASSQGFQVILPQGAKPAGGGSVLSMLQPNINVVTHVSDDNVAGNVDVET